MFPVSRMFGVEGQDVTFLNLGDAVGVLLAMAQEGGGSIVCDFRSGETLV
jgi:hypothetical protein